MFIKIMDRQTVLALAERGFNFTREKINKGTEMFVFEKTPELVVVISENFNWVPFIEEETLRFGGGVFEKYYNQF